MIGEWKKEEASDSSAAAGEAATTAPRLGARLLGRLGLDLPRWVRGVLLLADPGMTPPISGTVSSSKFGVVLRPPPFKWLWLQFSGVLSLLLFKSGVLNFVKKVKMHFDSSLYRSYHKPAILQCSLQITTVM